MDSQESRLREELAAHLEELTTDYEREGMSPRAARRAARLKWRQLGDATSRAGIPCRQSKPALKRPAGATKRKVASHLSGEEQILCAW